MLHSRQFIERLLIADSVAACHHHMMPGLGLLWLPGAFAGLPNVHDGLTPFGLWGETTGSSHWFEGKKYEKVQHQSLDNLVILIYNL